MIKGDGKKSPPSPPTIVPTTATTKRRLTLSSSFIGSDPRVDLVPDVELDDAGYIVTDELMRTSIPGLFAVGDVRNTPFRQVVTSAADGAVAAHAANEYIDELRGQAYV